MSDLDLLHANLPALKAIQAQRARRKIDSYYPDTGPLAWSCYPKHTAFFEAGAKWSERCILAANRIGKCITFESRIKTDKGYLTVGELFERGTPFKVFAWDGEKQVIAAASAPFRKPGLHHCFRLTMSDGQWIECADHHRILTSDGWLLLTELLRRSGLYRDLSILESCPLSPLAGDPRSSETVRGSVDRYCRDRRHDDERPRSEAGTCPAFSPSLADALPRSQPSSGLDALASGCASIGRSAVARLSSLYDDLLNAVRCVASSVRSAYTSAELSFDPFQALPLPVLVSSSGLQSSLEFEPRTDGIRPSNVCRAVVVASNYIVRCDYIGRKQVYDFTVERFHNYIGADLVHHNTEGIGAYEATCHATGVYPKNWKGRRFSKPTNGWAAGDTSKTVKEIIQAKLLGPPGSQGTGMIPYDSILRTTTRTGLADAVDTIHIKHISGGTSTIVLKSYDQRREAFQGTERDWIWLDEEPPLDIYTECVMRTMATGLFKGGLIFITFTPVNGWTEVVDLYMDQTGREKAGRFLITASWDDAPHLSTAEKDKIYASLPPHQRDARSRGIPALGSGAIYPISEEAISCEPFELPDWWPRAYGLDVGWNRTAAIWGARDNDSGTVYLYGEHYYAHSEAGENSRAIKARGEWIPGVIDPASKGRSQADGQQLLNNYIQNGLDVSTAVNAREAGIYAVWQAMLAGKLKVFKSCASWWVEFRKYRRDDDGKIVKENDHLMDATRYFWMSGRDRMIVAPTQQINRPQERFHGSNGWMA